MVGVATKEWKSFEKLQKNTCWNISQFIVSWQEVNDMIGYKKNILKRLSEVNMKRGSSLCERRRWQIFKQFKDEVVNVKLQKIWGFHCLQYIVHLMNRFRASEEIPVH